jgi:hypothetical protein
MYKDNKKRLLYDDLLGGLPVVTFKLQDALFLKVRTHDTELCATLCATLIVIADALLVSATLARKLDQILLLRRRA